MSQENVKVMRELYEAFNRGDIPAVLGQMHENIKWTEADGDSHVGPQAIFNGLLVSLGSNWDGFRITPEEFFDAGDHVITLGTYIGTNKATEKTIRVPFAHVWSLEEGRVVRSQQFTDTKQISEAAEQTGTAGA